MDEEDLDHKDIMAGLHAHKEDGAHGNPRKEKAVQLLTELLSGIVNGLLMLSFCYVFSSLIFGQDSSLSPYIPVGAAQQITSAAILGLSFATYSDAAITIAGPDINPTIFFANAAEIILDKVKTNHADATEEERTQIALTTILISVMFGTAFVSVLFYVLGVFRLTRIVQFVPAAVLSGFLAAVGVIVIIKAVKAATGDDLPHHLSYWQFWALLAPALPIGIALYCTKRFHIGAPIITLPVLLFGPFILFYVIVYALGQDLDTVREMNLCEGHHDLSCGWLYEKFDAVVIADQWTYTFGQSHLIDWDAFTAGLPQLLIMLIIVTLDSLLKIAGTKKKLNLTDLKYDHEMQLGGKAHFLLVFLAGAPGYGQLKFNALNAGIIRNTTSRLPGIISGLFNAALWFAGFPLINYLPRFFIGALLIYAGLGFIVENLIDTLVQDRFTTLEYLTVWAIVILSQTTSLLVAVVVGVMASFVLFALQYSKTGVVKAVLSGSDFQSSVVRSAQEDAKLEHLSAQVVIIKLKRYIFFGSANQITDLVWSILDDVEASISDDDEGFSRDSVPPHDGLIHTIVMDFEDVYGIDFTACGALMELLQNLITPGKEDSENEQAQKLLDGRESVASEEAPRSIFSRNPVLRQFRRKPKNKSGSAGYTVLFTGMSSKVYRRLRMEGIIDLIHKSGYPQGPPPSELDKVIPNILTMPRTHRVIVYIDKLLKPFRKQREPQPEEEESAKDYLDDDDGNYHADRNQLSRRGTVDEGLIDMAPNLATPDYYAPNGEFSPKLRRLFPTLDLAMEWVEERLLERASNIRQRWLVFSESFRRLHELARLKAQHEPFEHILGGHLGDSVWKYVETIRIPQGARLLTAGQVNPHLFLLQHGRLTSYMTRVDNSLIRLQSHRRGAFINEDALFVEYPVSHTVIADEECIVLALSRESLKTLQAQKPEVAFEIHRNVLRLTARARNRLARELDVVDHWSLFERRAVQEDPIQTAYLTSVSRASSVRQSSSHHFLAAASGHHQLGTSGRSSRGSSFYGGHHGYQPAVHHRHAGFLSAPTTPIGRDVESQIPESSLALGPPLDPSGPSAASMSAAAATATPTTAGATTGAGPSHILGEPDEAHLRSTSRKVGRAIMREAAAAFRRETAKKESTALAGGATHHHHHLHHGHDLSGNEAKTVPARRSHVPAAQDYDLSEMVQRIQNEGNPSLPSGSSRSISHSIGQSEASSHTNTTRRNSERRNSDRLAKTHSRSSSQTWQRTPSLRPDLRHLKFYHAPSSTCAEASVDSDLTRQHTHLSRVQELDAVACLRRAASNRFHSRGKQTSGDSPTAQQAQQKQQQMQQQLYLDNFAGNRGAQLQPVSRNSLASPLQQPMDQSYLAGLFETALPRSRLRQTLMDMGHFPSDIELDDILMRTDCVSSQSISETQFLAIVKELSLERLSDDEIYGFALFFQRHARVLDENEIRELPSSIPVLPNMVLTVDGMEKFLQDIDHEEDQNRLEKMFAEWSDFTIQSYVTPNSSDSASSKTVQAMHFATLCSMMAWHIHAEKLYEQVAVDFANLTVGNSADDLLLAEDIVHQMSQLDIPCSWEDATEMVFEADLSSNGGVSYEDLVETLTTVFDSEIEPQLEQLNQDILEGDQVVVRTLTKFSKENLLNE